MSIGIVTDTACDLSIASLLRMGVAVAPHTITLGEERHRDWRDVDPPTLYEWMLDQNKLPQAEAPEPEMFIDVYRRFLELHEEIISVHVSAKLSKTLEHARTAAKALQVEDRITFVDSEAASVALAEIVTGAAELAAEKSSKQHILWEIERIKKHMKLLCTPESLEWLVRYKQTGRPEGLISTVTQQRPLYILNGGAFDKQGTLTYHRVTDNLISLLHDVFGTTPIRLVMGTAGNNRADIESLKLSFGLSGLDVVKGRVQMLGGFMTCRFGPGTIVVCAYPALSSALSV